MTYKTGSNYKNHIWDTFITKIATESITTDATVNTDAELKTVLPVGTYIYELNIIVQATANSDFKYTMNFTGTATGAAFQATSANRQNIDLDVAQPIAVSTWPIGIIITGFIQVSVAGTLALQWAQNASHADATAVELGSTFKIKQTGATGA